MFPEVDKAEKAFKPCRFLSTASFRDPFDCTNRKPGFLISVFAQASKLCTCLSRSCKSLQDRLPLPESAWFLLAQTMGDVLLAVRHCYGMRSYLYCRMHSFLIQAPRLYPPRIFHFIPHVSQRPVPHSSSTSISRLFSRIAQSGGTETILRSGSGNLIRRFANAA